VAAAGARFHSALAENRSEEWARQFRIWADSHDPNIPVLSDEAMSREKLLPGAHIRLSSLLPVGRARSQRDLLDDDCSLSLVRGEDHARVTDPPPECALPPRTSECLYVAMEWIGSHLRKNPSHAFLDSSWETAEVLLGIGTEPTTQFMFYVGPWPRLPLACLFEALAQALRLGGSEHVIGSTTRLGFTSTPLPCFANATKSPSRIRRLSKSRGNHHLARWPMRSAFSHGCTCLSCHTLRLSDYQRLSRYPFPSGTVEHQHRFRARELD